MRRGPVFLNFNHTHHQIAISRCMIKIKISWINSSSGGPRCICHFWVSKLSPFHHFIKTRFSKVLLGDPISKTVIQKMKKLEMVPLLFFHNLKSSKSQEYLIFFLKCPKSDLKKILQIAFFFPISKCCVLWGDSWENWFKPSNNENPKYTSQLLLAADIMMVGEIYFCNRCRNFS